MRKELQSIPKYQPAANTLINLAQNENYYLNWQSIITEQVSKLTSNINFGLYGDNTHHNLIEKYAKFIGVDQNMICPSAGSDSMIGLLFKALTKQNLLTYETDFFRYEESALIADRNLIHIDNEASIEEITNKIKEENIELMILSNPNNPLSTVKSLDFIEELLKQNNIYIVVDEAYVEYAKESCIKLLNKYENLIVLRTLSKAWGMAMLRVGFVVTNAKLCDYIDTIKGPFTLSDIVSNIAAIALDYQQLFVEKRDELIKVREDFYQYLLTIPELKVNESSTNFIFIKYDKATKLKEYLKEHNILVSQFKDGLRITIGTQEMMSAVKETMTKYINEMRK